jgi:hypothetical protein
MSLALTGGRSGLRSGSMTEMEYLCTHSAHNPESLTAHMNTMAGRGWELVTVDFAIRGETGFHTFFWRRPLHRSERAEHAPGRQ